MQKLIENSLESSGLILKGADTARDKKELADILSPMLRRVRLIITVGGIGSAEDSPETVLCGLLVSKDKKKTEAEKLTAGKSTAYIIENRKQTIVCLPDEAENCRGRDWLKASGLNIKNRRSRIQKRSKRNLMIRWRTLPGSG